MSDKKNACVKEVKDNWAQELRELIMTERNYEADKCIISPAAWILVGIAGQSIHPRHVAVKATLQTSDDHPCQTKRCLSPSEW